MENTITVVESTYNSKTIVGKNLVKGINDTILLKENHIVEISEISIVEKQSNGKTFEYFILHGTDGVNYSSTSKVLLKQVKNIINNWTDEVLTVKVTSVTSSKGFKYYVFE